MRIHMRRRLATVALALATLVTTTAGAGTGGGSSTGFGFGLGGSGSGGSGSGGSGFGGSTAGASPGPIAVLEYDLGDEAFTDRPDWGGVSEMRAIVHYPRQASGKLPVVVLLHGQQVACHSAHEKDWNWPCPRGVDPYPSYRGYDYLAHELARDGFAVVSISANGLNFHTGTAPERAHLVNRHLKLLQHHKSLRNRLDFTRVGTMGHSVAGEGVMYQAADAHQSELPAGVRIRGVAAVASPGPIPIMDTRVTTAPIAVISAGCWSLGNERHFGPGVHGFRIRVTKGNHNFYNTEWTKGPGPTDGDDSECRDTPGRPTTAQHQALAVNYLRAFYRYTLKGDSTAVATLTAPFPGVDTERVTY
ncbi:hypothetical protein [Actinoplanes rectilineatus]|uniref:hypothetical protein n=1 Tax=Actinoplanes rectilineatus TaxID=113571 RepID=UPI0012FC12E3|nr:hypothetical protein [Actinoplanes rectilineatus]